jgi:hypothetical protein
MLSLNNLSLGRRISLLVLGGLVIGLGLFSWLGIRSMNESTERILNERLSIARIMAAYMDEELAHFLSHLQNAAFRPGGIPANEDFGRIAASLRQVFYESGISLHSSQIW